MIKHLLSLAALLTMLGVSAQSTKFERYVQGTGGTRNDTLDDGTVVVLDLSTDDVEQENFEIDSRYDDDLDCGWEGEPEDLNTLNMGIRFQDLFIPQGTTIDSAYIVFHAHEGKTSEDVAEITFYGEAADDAPTFDEQNFNDDYLVTDRPRTSASTKWSVAEDWVIWQPYKTADLGPIVQEIVNRPGWESGNSMAFIMTGEDQGPSVVENAREFTAYENIADPDDVDPEGNPGDGTNHPERRPYLVIWVNGTLSAQAVEKAPLRVYPNPVANGELNIQFEENAPAQVELYSMKGEKVRSFNSNEQNPSFNLGDLPAQLYLMKVVQNGKSYTKKVIIE